MFKNTLFSLLFLFSIVVNAATIDFNYTTTSSLFTANDGSQTEWLHISESANYSYNQIINEFGTGADFDGYTLASRAEVGLVTDQLFGWNWSILGNGYNTAYQGYTDQAALVWGYSTQGINSQNTITGLTGDFSSGYPVQLAAADPLSSIDPNYDKDLIYSLSIIDANSSSIYSGSFLYKPASVPVPAAAWLFGSGLIGLVGFARRKKA